MVWEILSYGSLAVIVLITIFSLEASIKRIEARGKRIERSLSLILQHLNIDLPSPVPPRIQALALEPKHRILAIKLYRQETGASLKEAKAAIDDFIAGNHDPSAQ